MLKKLYILVTLSTLVGTLLAESINTSEIKPSVPVNKPAHEHIDAALNSIMQAKNDIMFELKQDLSLYEKADLHFQNVLGDQYLPVRQECLNLLTKIIAYPEFAATTNEVTDAQVALIIDKNSIGKDVIIGPSAVLLMQKIENELVNTTFEETEQLFNVFYATIATTRTLRLLLEKLAAKEKELLAERAHLQPADQVVAA